MEILLGNYEPKALLNSTIGFYDNGGAQGDIIGSLYYQRSRGCG